VFRDKGYAEATLDDVIAISGGSRQTLYSLFGGKQGLFEALIAERCGRIYDVFASEALLDRPPGEVLLEVGVRLLDLLTSPEGLGIYRLIVAEGARMKELAERFWAIGPGRNRALLAQYFERQNERGTLGVANPEAAAHHFSAMVLAQLHLKCLLGLRDSPSPEEIEATARAAVWQFLHGSQPAVG
jgi:AcrR family transcriptional regulator